LHKVAQAETIEVVEDAQRELIEQRTKKAPTAPSCAKKKEEAHHFLLLAHLGVRGA